MYCVSSSTSASNLIESENMRKDSAYPPELAYYAERFCLSSGFGVLCRRILSIPLLRELRQKLPAHCIVVVTGKK